MASHTVLREQLSEMGFEENQIVKALTHLGEKATIESVIESIEKGLDSDSITAEDKPNEELSVEAKAETNGDKPVDNISLSASEADIEAKRIAYEEKIKQRRAQREAKSKEDELRREIKRRQEGKDLGKMKEELQQLERKRMADEMKREKAEQKAAKDAILQQIASDREERRNRSLGGSSQSTPAPTPLLPTQQSVNKEGKCRLAIRLLDGKQLMSEFDSREPLSAVRVYVITQASVDGEISFVMPPLPPFNEEDMQKPLNVLGLCPSARVHVVKR